MEVVKYDSKATSFFCFVCGHKLEDIGIGWTQCSEEKCGEVFLLFEDKEGNQNMTLQSTPFSKI